MSSDTPTPPAPQPAAAPEPGPAPIAQTRPAPSRWPIVAAGSVLLAAAALVFAWRADQRIGTLEQELVRRQQDSAAQASEARALARQADEGMRAAAAKVALLEARLAEVSIQRGQLEDLIQSLSRSRDENLVVDIEAALRVALQQSALTGSAEPLVATLRQSDERLARYNQPRLEGVRRAIARDLDKVRSSAVTDIGALTIRLDEAIRMVDDMPLLAAAEQRREPPRRAAAAQGGRAAASAPVAPASRPEAGDWRARWSARWSEGIDRVWSEARSLVAVTRIENPEALLLQPEHALFLRENLKLRLLNARLALISRQFAVAQLDLQAVQAALERYFDRSAKRTVTVSDLVRQVAAQARQATLPRPDDTLAALATAAAGR